MLVSVVMSVYNAETYLRKAIHSILSQTYTDFEFVIIDDGSNDKSNEILKSYANTDPRIILIENKKNIGLAASLNKGIMMAKGKYIARQDADDISDPFRLETQIQYALKNPHIDIIGSNSFVIDINDKLVYKCNWYSKITDFQKPLTQQKSIFPHGCVLIKKNKLIECGLYDSRFYYSQDGELWLRLISKGAKIYTIETPLYYWRMTPITHMKKAYAQSQYNKVKRMIYVDNADCCFIQQELERINDYIQNSEKRPVSYSMAKYWKNLANASFINNNRRSTTYKYILKAFKEKNSLSNYVKYISLACVYVFPPSLIKRILKTGVQAA